jgi:hypothetical protein
MENNESQRKSLPKWSDVPYAGETQPPIGVTPRTGLWPMYFFRHGARGRFIGPGGRQIRLEIAEPSEIDFAGEELREVQLTMEYITKKQIEIAKYWNAGPPTKQWTPIIDRLIDTYNVPATEACRILATVQAAMNDITIITWHLKYLWQIPRPNQLNRNLATVLCTPYHPSYPAGHATIAGCAQAVLSYFFPHEAKRLEELANECALSRLYGGVHYPADITQGLNLGRQIGEIIAATLREQKDTGGNTLDDPRKENRHARLSPPPYVQAIPFEYRAECKSKLLPSIQEPEHKKSKGPKRKKT